MLDALNIHFLVSITTLYLTTDLNVRVKIINLLEENTGKKFNGLKLGNDFLDLIPKHKRQEKKKKTDSLYFLKIRNFCAGHDNRNKVKRQPKEWEKILANFLSDKEAVSRINV